METMEVRIKRVDKAFPLPQYYSEGACAFDLYSRQGIDIHPQEIYYAPSNLIIEVPKGYVLFITPRSSLFQKHGLLIPNSPCIIDNDFCGEEDELKVPLYNSCDKVAHVLKGERIAQGIFVPISYANWAEIKKMNNKSRGGFGATDEILAEGIEIHSISENEELFPLYYSHKCIE